MGLHLPPVSASFAKEGFRAAECIGVDGCLLTGNTVAKVEFSCAGAKAFLCLGAAEAHVCVQALVFASPPVRVGEELGHGKGMVAVSWERAGKFQLTPTPHV